MTRRTKWHLGLTIFMLLYLAAFAAFLWYADNHRY